MLSRIAGGLYRMAREIERAQNVVRILEVNHKMDLERESLDGANTWNAIAEAFSVESEVECSEAALYTALVISDEHPFAVRRCITAAREEGRTKREHISEEMWDHLNRYHRFMREVTFAGILRFGRSEFNRSVETFCDAFHGLADDTMIHDKGWHFLRLGRFVERGEMICRILDIKRKNLSLGGADEGDPLDVHHWQALLRTLSGYEPYRRAHDARIRPAQVLDFALRHPGFPRSIRYCLEQIAGSLTAVGASGALQREACAEVRAALRSLESEPVERDLEASVRALSTLWHRLEESIERAYFQPQRPVEFGLAAQQVAQ